MSWPLVKFSEVTGPSGLFVDGDWVESKDQDPEGDVRLIQLADIGVGEFLDRSNRFMTSEKADKLKCSHLEAGDILVARMPDPIGRACIFPSGMGKCVTVVDICIVRPDSERFDSRWLMHLINSKRFNNQVLRHVTGTTRQRISRGNLAKLEIPLPPLPEQKRIAAILDKADAIRRKRQQAIQLADDFLRAVFLDMFGDPVTNPKGWDAKPLSVGIRSVSSGWSASGENRPCGDGEKGVLKISAVTSGVFKPEENKVVPPDRIPDGKKLLFPKKGDFLFSRANTKELVAASCIVNADVEGVFLPDKLWLVETDQEQLFPEFLNFLFWHPRFKERLTSQATGTSGSMLNISKIKLEETDSVFPDINVQKKFKDIYWAVQETIDISTALREGAGKLFYSLNQKAFSGQL